MGKYSRANGTKAGMILPVKRNTCTAQILIEMRCLFIKQIYIHELCLNEVYENNMKWLYHNCLFCNTECSGENETIQRKINVSLKLPNPSVIAFLSFITLTFTRYITTVTNLHSNLQNKILFCNISLACVNYSTLKNVLYIYIHIHLHNFFGLFRTQPSSLFKQQKI